MNKLLMMAAAAMVSASGVAVAQDAGQTAVPQAAPGQATPAVPDQSGASAAAVGATAPMAAPEVQAGDARAAATQSPDMSASPAASAPRHYPLCSRTLHDECRNPGGK